MLHLKDLADLDFSIAGAKRRPLDPLDGLFQGLDLQDSVSGDDLLGLGEWAVDDSTSVAGELDTCAFGAGMEAIHSEQHASLDELFIELAHLLQQLWIGAEPFLFLTLRFL